MNAALKMDVEKYDSISEMFENVDGSLDRPEREVKECQSAL